MKDKLFKRTLIVSIFLTAIILIFFLPLVFSGKLILNPILITLGPLEIRWYGLLIASGIFISFYLANDTAKKWGISEDDLSNAVVIGIFFSIIGARLYYVVFNWDIYSKMPSEIYKIWHGGMAIHGGILGALLSVFLYTKLKKNVTFNFLTGLDLLAHVLPLGQAIGRWGNFVNYEAYGAPTELPWKMFVPKPYRMPGYEKFEYFHPTFLYESLWNLGIFLFLFYYARNRKKFDGEIISLYLILYSSGRAWIELLRTDSLMFLGMKVAVLISILFIIIGIFMYFILKKKTNNSKGGIL
ncbi:phosphatidylglycerol:prolipoprotein diacylglycerol transferase [Marinitoga hydrogenitolerans DSM 16785]|uniref:Phosphatidylglycerol--prolipoprotein diacylglyceryl transferase n=1 Tax=Marinitoga hydrogenitolerans (strain DSM 16785 / JCM 12826 / AT1271) TaxID=1122195 RepID=A0A1M4WIB4_MARH1|nr:prolipoprotein diacylglyceryl transferase [Marinitoga hydrogenitolerans]SHE81031.1 phosphatidylglycerol:prolipoprotein diacylglycerol transferase [Marinitoga hydrogenitolerans DSM 16785]